MFLYVQPSIITSGNIRLLDFVTRPSKREPQSQYGWFLVENLTQCLLETEKKSFSMTNMKMIDQVCYSLCDKFSTITGFCHDLLCKEGSVRHYYRDNDTFTFSIYTKYLHLHYVCVLRFGFLKYSTSALLTVQQHRRTNDQASHYHRHMPLSQVG